jgi:hypothetical protein
MHLTDEQTAAQRGLDDEKDRDAHVLDTISKMRALLDEIETAIRNRPVAVLFHEIPSAPV